MGSPPDAEVKKRKEKLHYTMSTLYRTSKFKPVFNNTGFADCRWSDFRGDIANNARLFSYQKNAYEQFFSLI